MALLNLIDSSAEPREIFLMRGRDILVASDGQPVRVLPDAAYIRDAIYDTFTGTAGVELSREFVSVDGSVFIPLRQFFFASMAPDGYPIARPIDLGERPRLSDIRPDSSGEKARLSDTHPDSSGVKARLSDTRLDSSGEKARLSDNRPATSAPALAAARMRGYLNWRSSVRFCPSCGAMLEDHPVENARVCPECGKVQYPRIEPCVIAVICRGKEILLLRHAQRNQDIWCCLAGFVEAGESLEQALRREVKEETGLEIGNIRYAGSQSWPFPDQLMVGFYADYAGGDIVLQESEILEAGWFRTDNLPPHPSPGSISWNLIHFMPITNE